MEPFDLANRAYSLGLELIDLTREVAHDDARLILLRELLLDELLDLKRSVRDGDAGMAREHVDRVGRWTEMILNHLD